MEKNSEKKAQRFVTSVTQLRIGQKRKGHRFETGHIFEAHIPMSEPLDFRCNNIKHKHRIMKYYMRHDV